MGLHDDAENTEKTNNEEDPFEFLANLIITGDERISAPGMGYIKHLLEQYGSE